MSYSGPGYVPYPRQPVEPPPNLSIGLDVIPEAWQLFKQQPGIWLLNGLTGMLVVVPYLIYVTVLELDMTQKMNSIMPSPETQDPNAVSLAPLETAMSGLGIILALSLAVAVVLYIHMAAPYPLVAKQLRKEPIGIKDVLSLSGNGLQVALSSIAMTILVGIGYSFCYLPGPLTEGITLATPFRAVDLGEYPGKAIGGSYKSVQKRLVNASVTVHLLTIILAVAGSCGIGLIVGIPLFNICRALLYHRLKEAERLQVAPYTQPRP